MKFNGTIFSKPQQDQLKEIIGNELESVVEKVNDVDNRMLNYAGDWVSDNEYHVNDVVTWAHNGHLYEVIKAHTSSASLDPDNPEYYKAMTSRKVISHTFTKVKELYAYLKTVDYSKIKFLTLNDIDTLAPQGNAQNYSATLIYNNSGAIRHTIAYLYESGYSAFYVDVAIDGTRTMTGITINKYTLYTEE